MKCPKCQNETSDNTAFCGFCGQSLVTAETYILNAKSDSSDEVYQVTFRFENGKVAVRCGCPAGELLQMCKHKRELCLGQAKRLADQQQLSLLQTTYEKLQKTKFFNLYQELENYQKQIEEQKKELTKQASQAKNTFAKQLSEGI